MVRVCRDALETAGLESGITLTFPLRQGERGLILTLSLEGLEGFGQEKRKKDITDRDSIMSKSCPEAFLKIVPAGENRGRGRL